MVIYQHSGKQLELLSEMSMADFQDNRQHIRMNIIIY